MKLSVILEKLLTAGLPYDQILAVVVAYEDDKAALIASLVPPGQRLSSRQWTKVRTRILNRDERICAYCGEWADTVDHVQPIAIGGSNDDDNLVACCRYCNTSKGAKPLGEWRAHH